MFVQNSCMQNRSNWNRFACIGVASPRECTKYVSKCLGWSLSALSMLARLLKGARFYSSRERVFWLAVKNTPGSNSNAG